MKRTLLLCVAFMASLTIMAQQRSAKAISQIVNGCSNHVNTSGMKLKAMSSAMVKSINTESEAFAVYAAEDRPGFVIVSADERMPEVLAISDSETFDTMDGKNEALVELLNNYAEAHRLISEGQATAEQIFGRSANIVTEADSKTKKPLLGNMAYDQDAPYNRKTPLLDGNPTPTGCVATAAAQLMKYYEYPAVGVGYKSYVTKTNSLHVDFDFVKNPFDWKNMLDTYPGLVDDPDAKVVYKDNKVFVFNGGTIEYDDNRPRKLKLTKIYQYSGTTISGKLLIVVEDASAKIKRIASAPKYISELENNYGWNYLYIEPNLPSDLPDGEYKLFVGFTSDDINYTYAKKSSRSGYTNYSITVEKKGDIFTWQDNEFICSASVEKADAVATLMAACGAACGADYQKNETSANTTSMYRALNTYFGYDKDGYFLDNEFTSVNDMYIAAKKNLDANHITPVSGHTEDNKSGHSYLIDGYDMTGEQPMFHINWGWSGMSNGYFLLTQMQPSAAGTGGSASNYSGSYNLYMNVCPENNTDDGKLLCGKYIYSDPEVIMPNESMKIYIQGFSNNNFSNTLDLTKLSWYLVDEAGNSYKGGNFKFSNISKTSIDPGKWYEAAIYGTVKVPTTIPNGTYNIALKTSDNDEFHCLDTTPVTVTGSFTAIDHVKAGAGDSNSNVYDVTGKKVSSSHHGIQIQNGLKRLKIK